MKSLLLVWLILLGGPWTTFGNLVVKVNEPKTIGSKAIIKLEMKNTFAEKIESARATLFLIDDQGKVVGQKAQWVIGGTRERSALAADGTTTFNFVVPTDKPFSKTKVTFTRLVLEGAKSVNVSQNVKIEQ